ncbi:TolB-like translocation protein [Rhodanobacter hydrolyticus]
MRLSTAFATWMSFASIAAMSSHAPTADGPVVFAPDAIPAGADDGAAVFTPDGATVYFMRGTGDGSTLMESRHRDGRWSPPTVAPFSGRWHDLDPAMAPDGSFLLFASNRPATPGDPPLDAVHGGKRHVGQGMNLWRVDWRGDHWSTPVRLPDVVNRCSLIASPSIAADGSLYFIGCAGPRGDFALLRSPYRDGRYATPRVVALGDVDATIRDPAIAPDGSFIVVSVKHAAQQPYRLAIAFRTPTGWSALQDLGDAVNGGKENMGAQLGPDHHTLYFYSDRPAAGAQARAAWTNGHDHIWQVSLTPWLDAHAGHGR